MSIRKVPLVGGEYYHIYNRGNSKQKIFNNSSDYDRFIKILYLANSSKNFNTKELSGDVFIFDRERLIVSLGAYCLMPNHFHLLICSNEEHGISKFMQKLSTAYCMYYNKKYKRTGSLFEGKFKAQHIDNDKYLKYIFSYIHLNPIKIIQNDWKERGIENTMKVLKFLNKYKYSSYQDYINPRKDKKIILNREAFPDYFPTKENFQKDILEWLSYKAQNP